MTTRFWTAPTAEATPTTERNLLKNFEEKLFEGPVRFLSRVSFEELPESPITQVQDAATTFSALNGTRFQFSNSGAVSVTDITNGQDGQVIFLLGDGNTTLVDNTRLELGANLLLATDKIYPLLYVSGKWYPLSVSAPTAGAGISVSGTTVTNKYIGKHVSLYAASATQPNNAGTLTDFPNGVRQYVAVADLTNMTQYRVHLTTSTPSGTGITVDPQYSTNGTAWTAFGSNIAITPATGVGTKVSAIVSLPAGARIATSYITVQIACSEDIVVYTIGLEFTP